MILADTSVWIDHLRAGDRDLAVLLTATRIMMHPFVLGEIACGNLENRAEVLKLLADLPELTIATDLETLYFIERRALAGQGIGYIDAHLLAAVSLSPHTRLWTRDKRLEKVAIGLNLGCKP